MCSPEAAEKEYVMKFFGYDKENVKKAIHIAWPAVLESFFTAFVGLVDSFMVSSLGAAAVASVGLTTQPKFIGFSLFFATNVSVSALVARRQGEKNKEGANRVFATTLLFVILAAIGMSILLVWLADPIIHLCGSEADTHAGAVTYFRIIMGGMIFNCVQMCINAAQRGAGNTKITMRTNLVSNLVNVTFNYLLIGGHFGFPALGIAGAALATVLGSVVACFMSIWSVRRMDRFVSLAYILKNRIRPTFTAFKNLVSIGYSVFAEQLLVRVGFMATSLMMASQGTQAMAAHQVGMNILGLSFSFGDGLQATAVALIGFSLGAKKPELAKEYGGICRTLGTCISIVLATLYLAGGRWLYSMFFEEPEIVAIGVKIMIVAAVVVMLQISQVIYMGCLRGAGDTLYTAMASTISVSIVRTAVSYIGGFLLAGGVVGIWMGIVADQVSRLIFGATRFKKGRWTEIKI